MNRLLLSSILLSSSLLLGVGPALAQGDPTPAPKENSNDRVTVGGHLFLMPDHPCSLAATVVGRTEDLDGQVVTLRIWEHKPQGWEPGDEFETDVRDPDNPIHDGHVGDLFCLGVAK